MEREVLFRGRTCVESKWVEGDLGHCPVGQFTGLTDRHGAKIFEGDLISLESGKVYEVWWDKRGCRFVAGHPLRWGPYMSPATMVHCAVVGNIHDNPELRED